MMKYQQYETIHFDISFRKVKGFDSFCSNKPS